MPKVMPEDLIQKGLALLVKKGQDYTTDRDETTYENFDRSAEIASWFKKDRDKPFAVLIGTKLARLATLLNSDKEPNNESIEDSFVDGSNYFALWGGRVLSGGELLTLADPNPSRNTNCWFCSSTVPDEGKVISGKYRQAHIKCYAGATLVSKEEFLRPYTHLAI